MKSRLLALVSTQEKRDQGYRVAQIVRNTQSFEVAPEMFWQPCPDYIIADQYWFDPVNKEFFEMPTPVLDNNQPITTGSKDF
jgi:hypothetical protein